MIRFVRRLVRAGRFKHSFALAVVLALVALPVMEAAAYFSATGTGTISNVQAGTSASTVTIAQNGAFVYAGPSTTNLVPGGTVAFPSTITCTAVPPCVVPSVSLQSWTSNQAGCTSALMPNSFTISAQSAAFPVTINTVGAGGAVSDNITVQWNNLASINQGPCAGGTFAFVLSVP